MNKRLRAQSYDPSEINAASEAANDSTSTAVLSAPTGAISHSASSSSSSTSCSSSSSSSSSSAAPPRSDLLSYFNPARSDEERAQARRVQIARLRQQHRQFAHVPDDYFAETQGVHNPGGPSVRLAPPPRPASPEEHALPATPEDHLVIDLSQPTFTLPNGAGPYAISPQAASHARQYAALSTAYLEHLSTPPTVITPSATPTGSGQSVASAASAITRRERRQAPHAYEDQGLSVGHVPDSSVSGVAHSPMGFMAIHPDANSLVGYGSHIGAMTGQPIHGMVVREKTGRVHRYRPKSAAAAADPSGSSSSSSSGSDSTGSSSTSSSSTSSSSLSGLGLGTSSSLAHSLVAPAAARTPIQVPHDPSWSGSSDEVVEHPRGSGQRWKVTSMSSSGQSTLTPHDD